MVGGEDRREERRCDTRDQSGMDLARQGKARRIGLKLGGLLALGEERAGRDTAVIVEDVMDEMRGKGDQVGGKQPRRQDARYSGVRHVRGFYPQLALMATRQVLPSRLMATIVTLGGVPLSVKRMTSPTWSPLYSLGSAVRNPMVMDGMNPGISS